MWSVGVSVKGKEWVCTDGWCIGKEPGVGMV